MSVENRLIALKETIEMAKTKKARAEGTLQSCMTRLKDEFGMSSIQEAQTKLAELENEIDTMGEEIEQEVDALEDAMRRNE